MGAATQLGMPREHRNWGDKCRLLTEATLHMAMRNEVEAGRAKRGFRDLAFKNGRYNSKLTERPTREEDRYTGKTATAAGAV